MFKKVRVQTALPKTVKRKIYDLLAKSQDIFSWTPSYQRTIFPDITENQLVIRTNAHHVIQKKGTFALQRHEIIWKNVSKLLKESIIKWVDFPEWLSNPIVVPKHSKEWRMCVDYKRLNKAIPKKPFLMSCIDQVVYVVASHEFLCFLDTYKGYLQISMAPKCDSPNSATGSTAAE